MHSRSTGNDDGQAEEALELGETPLPQGQDEDDQMEVGGQEVVDTEGQGWVNKPGDGKPNNHTTCKFICLAVVGNMFSGRRKTKITQRPLN